MGIGLFLNCQFFRRLQMSLPGCETNPTFLCRGIASSQTLRASRFVCTLQIILRDNNKSKQKIEYKKVYKNRIRDASVKTEDSFMDVSRSKDEAV